MKNRIIIFKKFRKLSNNNNEIIPNYAESVCNIYNSSFLPVWNLKRVYHNIIKYKYRDEAY